MTIFISALAAVALGFFLKWSMLRGWARYYANPTRLILPTVCPVCLKTANAIVEEDSPDRITDSIVILQRIQWWSMKIPHCSSCERKQVRDLIVGLSLAGLCVLLLFIFAPTPNDPRDVILYFFFAYPFYVFSDNFRKGVALGRGGSRGVMMKVRREEYWNALVSLNSAPVVDEVPLADNRGVWRK